MTTRGPDVADVRRAALPLRHPADLEPLLDRFGSARLVLGRRYDAFLYCDHTSALRPLHPLEHPDTEPETYPSGQ